MDSDEDDSFDERPTTYSDSALKDRFGLWLTNLAISCRRPQVNGPLPELQPYSNSQASGSQGNYQMFPADQNEIQHGTEAPLLSDVQLRKYACETLPLVEHTREMLHVVQDQGHSNEAVDVIQAQGLPSEVLHVSQPHKHRSGTVDVVHALSRDAETQTSIVSEGWKEMSDPKTATSNLPDVIYSSSESSAQSLPTSPDVLSNGASKEHEARNFDLVDDREASKQLCSEAAKDDLSSGSSDASLQQNSSFASVIGQPDSQKSDAGKGKERQFSSGYATQLSRQSANSFNTSCDDSSSVFSQAESARDSLDPSATLFMAGATQSLENLSSSETVICWADLAQKDSVTSGNLPDFDRLLSGDESKSTSSDHSVRDLLTEASGILGMAVANEDADVAVEIPVRVCQPELGALRMSEAMRNIEMMDQQLADYALQLINEGLTPVEVEQNLLESLNQLPAQNFAAGKLFLSF